MWRVSTSKGLAKHSLSPKSIDYVFSVPLNGKFSDASSKKPQVVIKPTTERKEGSKEPPKEGGSGGFQFDKRILYGAGVTLVGVSLVGVRKVANDEEYRFWVIDKLPASKSVFEKFGYCVDRPLSEPPKHGPNPTSVTELADQSVSGLNVNKALINDHNKQTEERNKLEDEKHKQKKLEQERKDAEYFQRQKEKAEKKAALEIEKSRKEDQEQKQAAEALIVKIQRNQEFETNASKKISEVCELADAAIKSNAQAILTCREHSSKLKEAMDVNLEEEALKIWPVVHELNEMRLQRVEEAHQVQQTAEDAIVAYIQFIDDAKKDNDTKDNQSLPSYRKQIQEIAYDVKSTYDKLKSQETVSGIMKHYYHMLKKDKADFKKELEAIVPEVKLGDKGLNLSEEELNALLAHAHRRIFQLKRQLLEQQLLEHQRLEDALCEQKKADMREANIKIGQELDKQYDELQLEKEAELMSQNRKFDTELKTKLSRQASEHQDHLQDMLALQQKKLMEQFDMALRERLIHERHVFIDQISKNMAKVKGLEAALEERADLQKVIADVQDLMSSAMCLMHAVAHEVDCKGDEFQIVRIDDSLKRCAMAGEHNTFVQAVLHTVPTLAAERGICTVSSLERRFENVYKQCSKASYYPDRQGLFQSIMSNIWYLISAAPKVKYTVPCEFENPEGMSPSELMAQAKYFVDRKCLPEAVRCLVQLSGNPRMLAQDWIDEARLVLEVRQAAEVLMAYANSRGMGTIF